MQSQIQHWPERDSAGFCVSRISWWPRSRRWCPDLAAMPEPDRGFECKLAPQTCAAVVDSESQSVGCMQQRRICHQSTQVAEALRGGGWCGAGSPYRNHQRRGSQSSSVTSLLAAGLSATLRLKAALDGAVLKASFRGVGLVGQGRRLLASRQAGPFRRLARTRIGLRGSGCCLCRAAGGESDE